MKRGRVSLCLPYAVLHQQIRYQSGENATVVHSRAGFLYRGLVDHCGQACWVHFLLHGILSERNPALEKTLSFEKMRGKKRKMSSNKNESGDPWDTIGFSGPLQGTVGNSPVITMLLWTVARS